MILTGRQRQYVPAIAQDNETGLFTRQEFFDHDARPLRPRLTRLMRAAEHEVHGLMRLLQRQRHHDALARSKSVGLDHDRCALAIKVSVRRSGFGESFIVGRRNAVALHEGFGKSLGTFQLSGGATRSKYPQAMLAKLIHHTRRQWPLRTHHSESDLVGQRPRAEFLNGSDIHVLIPAVRGGASVARCQINFLHPGRLRQLPRQRMFTTAAADDENLHVASLSISALW